MTFLVPEISSTLKMVWKFLANPRQLGFECPRNILDSCFEGQIAVIIVSFRRSKSLFKSGSRCVNSQ
jgi:hypothetical protein